MCGRRKLEKDYPELCDWGDMPYEMVKEIARQIPKGIICQFHNNGEPLLYPRLRDALGLFSSNIRCFNTNGNLLLDRFNDIVGNMETLTISVVQDDPEQEEQYETVRNFKDKSRKNKPSIICRLLGKVDKEERWKGISGIIAKRILHSPEGSFGYQKNPTIPEIGICLDLLTHLAIDRYGKISLCVRFDPYGDLVLGCLDKMSLEEAWNSPKRKEYIDYHIRQKRNELPGCSKCEYWGIATSP